MASRIFKRYRAMGGLLSPRWVFAVLAAWLALPVGADTLTTTDNQVFTGVHMDSIIRTATQVTFYLRGIRNDQVLGDPYPLPEAQVQKIEFRTPWDTAERPEGRPATMVMLDTRRFEGVWLETCTREGADLMFQIRQAGVPAGGDSFPVPLTYISEIVPTAMNLPGAVLPEVPGTGAQSAQPGIVPGVGLAPGMPPEAVAAAPTPLLPLPPGSVGTGEASGMMNVPPATGPTPPAEFPVTAPLEGGESPATGETPADQGEEGSDVASAFGTGSSGSSSSSYSYDSDDYEYGGGSRFSIQIFGYSVSLLSFLIGMVIAFVAGGISLYFSARTEGTSDLKFPKAIATAALLTVFPPLFFYLCARFIPMFGVWAGFAAWIFSARAIIMGMLEVLEAKAASILVWFYIYLIVGQYLAGKVIDKL